MPTLHSRLRLAILGAASSAMLSACAHSAASPPGPEPKPIVKVDRILEPVCPPEVTQDLPPRAKLPADASLAGSKPGLDYAAARFRREELLEGRLTDAKASCPKAGAP